ncbi:MAG: DUF739 family protein [Solobacterium sp.]|nr:DUF739 family protein [Solobacterium sp.]
MTERDYRKLRGRIVEKFDTQKDFAKAINKDISLVNQTLNGKREIKQEEIEIWAGALDIPIEEIPAYFFEKRVTFSQLEESA